MAGEPWEEELGRWEGSPLWLPGPATFPVRYGRRALERLLGARPDLLLLDAVTQVDLRQGCIRGHRRLDPDDPTLAAKRGEGPGSPEALQIECLLQLACCLIAFQAAGSPAIGTGAVALPRLRRILHASFLASLRPGDGLTLLARLLAAPEGRLLCAGQVLVDRVVCATAVVGLASRPGTPDP